MNLRWSSLGKILIAIAVCQLAGAIGSLFTFSAIPNWYAALNKPFFSPPNYVFGPVWTLLYFLMGVSLYLIWVSKNNHRKKALKIFFIQLTLNALWSIIFFGLKSPLLALLDIIALWISIILTIKAFSKISSAAAGLLIPYIAWVSFASLLNLFIVILN